MDKTKRHTTSDYLGLHGSDKTVKILVIQQKMIGDVLTSSIICENLKRNFPKAEVHYLVYRFTLPVIQEHPYIDKIVIFEDEFKKSKIKFFRFLHQISKENYKLVFDAYGKLESVFITLFSKAKFKYGFRKTYTKFLYSKTIAISNHYDTEAGTAIENRLALLKLLEGITIYNNKPKIYLTADETENAKNVFSNKNVDPGNCIMVSTLGSGKNKSYPLAYLAELLDAIVEKFNSRLILNYNPSQQTEINKFLPLCNRKTRNAILEDINIKSLRDFMAICSQCKAIIGNEGGAINMGKALDVPSFSIFSPWIIKKGWNSFEINHKNSSVHLSDFHPELYTEHPKAYKEKALEYYKLFKPGYFKEKVISFLEEL